MFGILVAGRLPANNFERVSEAQFLIKVNEIESVNHLVVFMTGETPFPDGFAGAGNKINSLLKIISFYFNCNF